MPPIYSDWKSITHHIVIMSSKLISQKHLKTENNLQKLMIGCFHIMTEYFDCWELQNKLQNRRKKKQFISSESFKWFCPASNFLTKLVILLINNG